MARRGFIGPIGDDIPSIFPLMAGIILFIATLIYANDEFNAKNSAINLRKAGLDMAYIVVEKGYVNQGGFDETCEDLLKPSAKKNNVFFAVMLRDCTTDPSESFAGTEICSLTQEENANINSEYLTKKQTSIYNYPIATDCETPSGTRTGLGSVSIITWYR
ncbi:MAG: hypothetical protein WCX64_03130 [Candidatus Micrarchaeia archaeon]